jgi:hypothetical protein
MTKKIVVYCCGGTGVNIGKEIVKLSQTRLHAEDQTPYAEIEVINIDTSESDLRRHTNRENTYLFRDMDGSGSDRSMNADEIRDTIPEILNKFRPGDLNIVLNSCGGGSGSVIGPFLIASLLAEEEQTIAIGVTNSDTVSRLRNTVRVLRSYEGVAVNAGRVLPVMLHHGDKDSENNINQHIVKDIKTLSMLFSGDIDRLDSADLKNWLNFTKITGGEVGAVALKIVTDPKNITEEMHICSVVSLTNNANQPVKFPRTMVYHPVGILADGNDSVKTMHFALVDGEIQKEHTDREKQLADMDRQVTARKPRTSIASTRGGSNGGVEI